MSLLCIRKRICMVKSTNTTTTIIARLPPTNSQRLLQQFSTTHLLLSSAASSVSVSSKSSMQLLLLSSNHHSILTTSTTHKNTTFPTIRANNRRWSSLTSSTSSSRSISILLLPTITSSFSIVPHALIPTGGIQTIHRKPLIDIQDYYYHPYRTMSSSSTTWENDEFNDNDDEWIQSVEDNYDEIFQNKNDVITTTTSSLERKNRNAKRISSSSNDNNTNVDYDEDDIFITTTPVTTTTTTPSIDTTMKKRPKITISPDLISKKSNTDHSQQQHEQSQLPVPFQYEEQQQPIPDEIFISTLTKYFGYAQYRTGQLDVIKAIINDQQDVVTLWPTGQGKSICYQIPALLSSVSVFEKNKSTNDNIVVVISPLVSLMEDQVHKINGLLVQNNKDGTSTSNKPKPIAAYLGSSQTDNTVESKALNGEYNLIYITPEKFVGNYDSSNNSGSSSSSSSSSYILERLLQLHNDPTNNKRIVCFAIDEAHTVSEWGHDFRPVFRQIGSLLRMSTIAQKQQQQQQKSQKKNIPLLALTATAVPRVQDDIIRSLYMNKNNTLIVQQSLDRTNLALTVQPKSLVGGGYNTVFKDILQEFIDYYTYQSTNVSTKKKIQSTIIYAPTRTIVDEITSYLQSQIEVIQSKYATVHTNQQKQTNVPKLVDGYHAGLTSTQRTNAHINFLTGQTSIIVASVAFGMGIDKPDIRRIIHYGTPKTLEEYYQQVGRAGRDGLPATCIMYYTTYDLDRYKDGFYLDQIHSQQAKESVITSINALKKFTLDNITCRRKAILNYFGEYNPSFGEQCGTCDNCVSVQKHGGEHNMVRNFGPIGSYAILYAISVLYDPSITYITKLLASCNSKTSNGNITTPPFEQKRYQSTVDPIQVQSNLQEYVQEHPKKYNESYYRSLISLMGQNGFLKETTKSGTVNGMARSWTTYTITEHGTIALNSALPITLPIPESVRLEERLAEEKRQKVLDTLQQKGINISTLPKHEQDTGDGDVIRTYTKWYNYLESIQRRIDNTSNINNTNSDKDKDRLQSLELLIEQIEQWRSNTAIQYRLAPGTVLAEHTLVSIAYIVATMPPGVYIDEDTLVTVGVRSNELSSLVSILKLWIDTYQSAASMTSSLTTSSNTDTGKSTRTMKLGVVQERALWKYAEYKPAKKTGIMVWESSYKRFMEDNENPNSIAIKQLDGKQPIQVKTVIGHLLDSIQYGKTIDLQRLAVYMIPPTEYEWEQLCTAEIVTGMDVTMNPLTSGPDDSKWTMTEFLRPIIGDDISNKKYNERTSEENESFSRWCDCLKWYIALRRCEYDVTFE